MEDHFAEYKNLTPEMKRDLAKRLMVARLLDDLAEQILIHIYAEHLDDACEADKKQSKEK